MISALIIYILSLSVFPASSVLYIRILVIIFLLESMFVLILCLRDTKFEVFKKKKAALLKNGQL